LFDSIIPIVSATIKSPSLRSGSLGVRISALPTSHNVSCLARRHAARCVRHSCSLREPHLKLLHGLWGPKTTEPSLEAACLAALLKTAADGGVPREEAIEVTNQSVRGWGLTFPELHALKRQEAARPSLPQQPLAPPARTTAVMPAAAIMKPSTTHGITPPRPAGAAERSADSPATGPPRARHHHSAGGTSHGGRGLT
jgi:hypothetical protein